MPDSMPSARPIYVTQPYLPSLDDFIRYRPAFLRGNTVAPLQRRLSMTRRRSVATCFHAGVRERETPDFDTPSPS